MEQAAKVESQAPTPESTAPPSAPAPGAADPPEAANDAKSHAPPVVEAQPEGEAKPAEKSEEPASKQFATLAKEHKILRREKEAFAAERKKLEAERRAEVEELAQHREFMKGLEQNAMAVLRKRGITYDRLVKEELKLLEEDTPEMKRIAALEAERESEKKAAAEAKAAAEKATQDAARVRVLSEISAHVKASGEKYEFISAYDAAEKVFDKLRANFQSTAKYDDQGNLVSYREMSMDEACDLIEREFEEAAEQIKTLKKFQKKLQPVGPQAPAPSAPKTSAKEKPVRKKLFEDDEPPSRSSTLDNSLTQGPAAQRKLTPQERFEQAWARFSQG